MEEQIAPLSSAEEPMAPPSQEPPAPAKRRRSRWPIVLGVLAALVLLFAFFIGSVELLHYTESTAFCSLCHVMKPEVTAYRNSPHARAECGTCHVGPGALPAVQAKLANVRYLWVYPLGNYERPIPSPIHSLRPVEVVCEQCHWPEKFYENRLVTLPEYATDEANSLTQTALLLKTGGGPVAEGQGRGIHWHIANPVYYIATDEKRQEIPWVSAEFGGTVTEYISTDSNLTAEALAKFEKRKMDCVDCHNRASHNFRRPADALNEALAAGLLPADLPAIKQQGLAVLERQYATEAEAADAIAAVGQFYQTTYPDVYAAREADVKAAVATLQKIFDRSQFPFMGVTWQSHPNNIGHLEFPGCFRCHDGKHLSADNQAIRLECNICHTIPEVAGPGKLLPEIRVAAGNEPETHSSTTWLAEHRYRFDTTCADCHSLENPGGSDNSSFCSNSACHATEWKYAGLDAPKIRELSAPPKEPSAGTPKTIPHPVGERTDCTVCHAADKVRPWPENHTSFTPDMCLGCHTATLLESGAPPPAGSVAPAVPHPLEGIGECKTCHGAGGMKPWPESHASFQPDMCTGCHKPAGSEQPAGGPTPAPTPASGEEEEEGGPPAIPHDLAGRDDCLMCHNPAGGVKPAPADHAGRAVDSCQMCHKPKQ